MTAPYDLSNARRGVWALMAATSVFLGACSQDEPVLPGVREDLRAVLQRPEAARNLDAVPANTARGISLPAASANASWPQGIGSPAFRTSNAALRANPQLQWSADIGDGDSRRYRITADPVVADGRIFTLDAGARVTATSTAGATLWSQNIAPAPDGEGQATGGGLAVSGNTVYISLGAGELVALDVQTGGTRWRQQLDAAGTGRPAVAGNLVYVITGDGTGWAVEKSTGRVQWQVGSNADVSNVLGASAPAVSDDLAIFGFGSGDVQAVFRQGGFNRWNAAVLGKRPGRALSQVSDLTGSPVVAGNTVFAGNQSGRIVAMNAGSGERLWTARDGAISPVWPTGGSIFAISDLNELLRLDAGTGDRIWGVALPNFVKSRPKRRAAVFGNYGPILAGGRVIVASSDGQLRSFDPTNGALVGTVAVPGGATTAPVVANGTLYVVTAKGKLTAFR